MGSIGATELLILLVIVLLVFGANRLPKLARSIGQSKREFDTAADKADASLHP